jgi:hypothetical protein
LSRVEPTEPCSRGRPRGHLVVDEAAGVGYRHGTNCRHLGPHVHEVLGRNGLLRATEILVAPGQAWSNDLGELHRLVAAEAVALRQFIEAGWRRAADCVGDGFKACEFP